MSGKQKRENTDQIGVVGMLRNDELLRVAVNSSQIGCDGTFKTVLCYDNNVEYELVSIMEKDVQKGNTFAVYRQISTRKTVDARRTRFIYALRKLKSFGFVEPKIADVGKRLSFSSDFETTFGIVFAPALCEVYHPRDNVEIWWEGYVRAD